MLKWLGAESEELRQAFIKVFGGQHRPFGSRSIRTGGLSDAIQGVQWNAGYDPDDGSRWVGVNLEGMQYDGWPIARLIKREFQVPTLPRLISEVGDTDPMCVNLARDYWQVQARPKITEASISPTPLLLSELTEHLWRQALDGALGCLNSVRHGRGRAKQTVTLAGSGQKVHGYVSPHLTIMLPTSSRTPWLNFLAESKPRLQPFYDWAVERAA